MQLAWIKSNDMVVLSSIFVSFFLRGKMIKLFRAENINFKTPIENDISNLVQHEVQTIFTTWFNMHRTYNKQFAC